MPVEVILPRVDMDMATGKISRWYVKEGETVTKGAPIFEIETDKAAMEVEFAGRRRDPQHLGRRGRSTSRSATAVAFIYGEGEAVAPPPQAPAVANLMPPHRFSWTNRSRQRRNRLAAAVEDRSGQPRATPLARRWRASVASICRRSRAAVPRGRIAGRVTCAKFPSPPARSASRQPADAAAMHPLSIARAATTSSRMSGMRRTIAQRLVQSKQTVPHFYLTVDLRR